MSPLSPPTKRDALVTNLASHSCTLIFGAQEPRVFDKQIFEDNQITDDESVPPSAPFIRRIKVQLQAERSISIAQPI